MRRRPPKPGQIPESAITAHLRYYLRLKRLFHFKHWGGPMSEKGVPDIIGCKPVTCDCGKTYGVFVAIEVKTEKGRLSEEQEAFLARIKEAGGIAFVARSVEDARVQGL